MASGWIKRRGSKDKKTGQYTAGRIDIYRRDNMVCCYCDKQCLPYTKETWKNQPLDVVTLDHITSQWAIAQTCESNAEFTRKIQDPRNLVCVCNGCNSSKKKTELYIWANTRGLDYAKILERIAIRVQTPITGDVV